MVAHLVASFHASNHDDRVPYICWADICQRFEVSALPERFFEEKRSMIDSIVKLELGNILKTIRVRGSGGCTCEYAIRVVLGVLCDEMRNEDGRLAGGRHVVELCKFKNVRTVPRDIIYVKCGTAVLTSYP